MSTTASRDELMRRKEAALSPVEARRWFCYDPDSGTLTWKMSPHARIPVGTIAGNPRSDGYLQVMFRRKQYTAHRLAWAVSTGEWPKQHIDHINGVRTDNRRENLRDVSRAMNCQNRRRVSKNSKTGFLGVRAHSNGRGFIAVVELNGVPHYGGYSPTREGAYADYVALKRKLHPGCTL